MSLDSYTDDDLKRELEKREENRKKLAAMPVERRLAKTLHSMLCHWNHTDGCSWHYESWDGPNNRTRQEWVEKAKRALQVADEPTIIAVLSAVR
jgi:hypothetical protein